MGKLVWLDKYLHPSRELLLPIELGLGGGGAGRGAGRRAGREGAELLKSTPCKGGE